MARRVDAEPALAIEIDLSAAVMDLLHRHVAETGGTVSGYIALLIKSDVPRGLPVLGTINGNEKPVRRRRRKVQ